MSQTVSVTEARDNFPALVRQVAEQDDAIVVTSRNQPRVVLVRWETYQQQQSLQCEGAKHKLHMLVNTMLALIATLEEAYRPDSYEVMQSGQELLELAKQAWMAARLLDTPRRHLASTISDGLLFFSQSAGVITAEQLSQLGQSLPLLQRADLTPEEVATADRELVKVGLDAMAPMDDGLAGLYGKANA